tara:strand:+ start:13088 stop:13249 length:162 start_codon:yes stop_codon:yes gene_type:complete
MMAFVRNLQQSPLKPSPVKDADILVFGFGVLLRNEHYFAKGLNEFGFSRVFLL